MDGRMDVLMHGCVDARVCECFQGLPPSYLSTTRDSTLRDVWLEKQGRGGDGKVSINNC